MLSIELLGCGEFYTNKTNCANATELSSLFSQNRGSLQLNLFTINTVVQPGSKIPILHYIDDTKTITFGERIGQVSVLEMAEY